MIREKKTTYWEKEEKRIVEEARRDPYIAIRPRKHNISMEEWSRNFNCILNKGREDSPVTNQETTAQEPAAWIP
jgi:hypothetical protein